MVKKELITQLIVQDAKIGIMRVKNIDYISITDLARYSNSEDPKIPIQVWMRNKDVISFFWIMGTN